MEEPKPTIITFSSFEQFFGAYTTDKEELTLIIPANNLNEAINGLINRFNHFFIDKVKINDKEFLVVNISK